MRKFQKNKFFLLLIAGIFFVAGYLLHRPHTPTISDFERTLHSKEARLEKEMSLLALKADTTSYPALFAKRPDYYNSLLNDEGLALLIYENDTLKFWSDNSIAVENWIREVCLDTRMVKLRNGWFEVMRPHSNSTSTRTIVGLILIRKEYPYQNKYLTNDFQKDFNAPAETYLITDTPDATHSIRSKNGQYLFSLQLNENNDAVSLSSWISVLLNLLGFSFLILFLRKLILAENSNLRIVVLCTAVLGLRYLSIEAAFPSSFYSLDLFGPRIFADASSVWLTSLGDLLINVVLLLYLTYIIYSRFDFGRLLNRAEKVRPFIIALLLFLLYYFCSWMITKSIKGLVHNSNIPFSINNLFSLNQYSYVGIIIIGLLLFVYFLFTDKMVTVLRSLSPGQIRFFAAFFIATAAHLIITQLLGRLDLIIALWPFALFLVIAMIRRRNDSYPFSGIVFLVCIFSLYSVHVLIKHSERKERESRKIYAERLAAERDPVAELLFRDLNARLPVDTVLSSFIKGTEKQAASFEKRLKQQHFSGFWDKYDLRVTLFDSMCVPVIKPQNAQFDNNLYFDDLIEKNGQTTDCENFYFLNDAAGRIGYIARLPVFMDNAGKRKFGTMYLELDARFIADEIGFPELLLDRNVGLSQELSSYSYARYRKNQLISQYGSFSYSLNEYFPRASGEFLDIDGYNHLYFRPDENTLIVLSKKNDGFIGQITTFSYLFSFFSLLLLSLLLFRQLSRGRLLENFSFKYRIQVLLVLIVLSSLALFGGGTIYYIRQQFETKNKENISEKIHSVLIDAQEKLGNETKLDPSLSEYVSFILKKFSTVFFTDINLYDAEGNLFASSSSKVFDEGLTSKKMNPEAFHQMSVLGKTEFIHDERIGKLEYLSAYIPFENKDGKLLAYLNLPYFAKQSELEKEISGFLVALINIYVLLFALSIITAIFISNYVTKPLKLIQDKLSKIKLGKTNEPIEWQENDEIGNLVKEYNRMIEELSKSAGLLAKSERESAWREMAKQVAHEIKNPLTPMKLSVQHLQRTWKDDDPDMDKKIERLTNTIIEQIDTLSSIATEFSNFAKMPKANLEELDLSLTLQGIVDLYRSEDVAIVFENRHEEACHVIADREQLLRVFNNLIKNAIQAIPEDREGLVKLTLTQESGMFLVAVADNGAGMSDEAQERVFTPNFTTKTGGMGLGLAMVKNIVEGFEGKIWFETQAGSGTTFYVSFPCAGS